MNAALWERFLDKYVETPLHEDAKLELANLMCRCYAYGFEKADYAQFRHDFNLGKGVPAPIKQWLAERPLCNIRKDFAKRILPLIPEDK